MTEKQIQEYLDGLVHTAQGIPAGQVVSDETLNEMADNWEKYINNAVTIIPAVRCRKDFIMGAIMVAKMWKASVQKKITMWNISFKTYNGNGEVIEEGFDTSLENEIDQVLDGLDSVFDTIGVEKVELTINRLKPDYGKEKS